MNTETPKQPNLPENKTEELKIRNIEPSKQKFTEPTAEELAFFESYMEQNPTQELTPTEIEQKEDVEELERLLTEFENTFDMEALFAITDLKPSEAKEHPVREPARQALAPIFSIVRDIGPSKFADTEKIEEFRRRWKRISNAVGMINNDKVDHNR